MSTFSLWHWLIAILIWWIAFGWPCQRILGRLGYNKWWVLISAVPLINIIALWMLATMKWPAKNDYRD